MSHSPGVFDCLDKAVRVDYVVSRQRADLCTNRVKSPRKSRAWPTPMAWKETVLLRKASLLVSAQRASDNGGASRSHKIVKLPRTFALQCRRINIKFVINTDQG